jgi:nucleoid-associated protein YgaU
MRYTVKKFFASLVCVALLAFGQTTIFAKTAAPATTNCPPGTTLVQGYAKKNGIAVAAHCKKSRKSAMSGASPAPASSAAAAPPVAAPAVAAPAATPAPATMTKGASTSGTAGATGTAAADAGATPCPEGKTYVHGYTTKKGETVKGYCRKVRAK